MFQETSAYSQSFGYDRYGNRQVTSAAGNGLSNYNPTYNTATNRINGLGYDTAGNITSDSLTGGTMTFDAENRMLTATSGGGGSYVYDGDGKRVRRITAGGQEWWYVYGLGGELVAEYSANAAPTTVKKEYGYRGGQLLITADSGSTANLALGQTATQSSTDFGGLASRGVDGNTSGNWANNSVTHTSNESQPWWQVDLGSVQQIGVVKVWNRTDCCSQRLSNFYVLVSDTPFLSTNLATTIGQAGVSSYYTAGPVATATEVAVYRSGRYVRVQLAGSNYLHLAEVEVRGGDGIQWLLADQLGSTRMVIDQTGSLSGIKRHDYAPFGEELAVGIRNAGVYGYVGSNVRQKFGSKERDIETGLDFFEARYFGSIQGRFTSVDPYDINFERQNTLDGQEASTLFADYVAQPQHWNRYAYALNNPLRYVDPDGLLEYETTLLGQKIKVNISDDISKKEQDIIKRKIDAGIDLINNGADKLTKKQQDIIRNVKGIVVRDDITRSGIGPTNGIFTIKKTPDLIYSEDNTGHPPADHVAAIIIHDSFHPDQYKRGLRFDQGKEGAEREREANKFAAQCGCAIGLDQTIVNHFDLFGINPGTRYKEPYKEIKKPAGSSRRPAAKKTP